MNRVEEADKIVGLGAEDRTVGIRLARLRNLRHGKWRIVRVHVDSMLTFSNGKWNIMMFMLNRNVVLHP